MLKRMAGGTVAVLLTATVAVLGADRERTVIVTSSNTVDNHLRVYDTAGRLIQEVPTLGQGGARQNAGGIATNNGTVAVVNFGSQTVSLFSRNEAGFELRQTIPTSSQPLSVAFGKSHLYVLGTTTVEFEDRYAIEPNFAEFGREPYGAGDGAKRVAEDFSYSSDNNHDWLSPEGLLAMLEEKAAR